MLRKTCKEMLQRRRNVAETDGNPPGGTMSPKYVHPLIIEQTTSHF